MCVTKNYWAIKNRSPIKYYCISLPASKFASTEVQTGLIMTLGVSFYLVKNMTEANFNEY